MSETTTTTPRRALLAADTDRTQAYVFESARLPEIRGASNLLRELNTRDAPELIARLDSSAQLIYSAGGGLLYEVAADRAEEIQQELEKLYPERTGVATITCVYRNLPSSGANAGLPHVVPEPAQIAQLSAWQRRRWEQANRDLGCFGAWVRLLGQDLRRRKQEKEHVPFVEAPSHAHRCQSCQTRPAQDLLLYHEGTQALCWECQEKKKASQRHPWRDEFDEKLHRWYPNLAQQYFASAPQGQIPRDIEMIAAANRPQNPNKRNYVAFIYADGDGVGSFVEGRRTRSDYEDTSALLHEATWRAVTFSIGHNLSLFLSEDDDSPEDVHPTQPFEIITVGGDDIMLLVPAHAALSIARDMAAEFRRFLDSHHDESLTKLSLSVSVVIGPTHMPVRLLRDFARELLKKSAKSRAHKEGQAVIDFQVFTSMATYGIGVLNMREHVPYTVMPPDLVKEGDKPLRLFCRPYTVSETTNLLHALQDMQKVQFPTSQLHQFAEALERGHWRSTLLYLYQRSRLRPAHRRALHSVETILPRRLEDTVPWYIADPQAPYAYRTALRDVAELYDFVPYSDVEEEL